ncbi:MAG TPA: LemA family protein [candidate division WOR-3 bacterium]|uniref:LemA family protein n=1 Tax=candidate division WOR-3 bacterium TaxID=2052148 RepID=A0A7V5HNI8_UNCW3|nr:LemA family protein [Candidatus Hydrothermae bacterium]RKY97031.1 MAG: LemA family protein [Candidatus Hydrothermae bacterium]HHF53529.1 LemA family protein [candidate division WOR-3 bacterium]
MILVVILVAIVILLTLYGVSIYNSLIKLRNMVRNAWSDIDVQLKKRHDLIPNLVETVKGYAAHEKTVLENVTKARSMAAQAKGPEESAQAENMLTQALRQLFAVVENYPDLKANQNFLALQEELRNVENQIQEARRYYNAVVRDYNIRTESFPSNIIASIFNFKKEEFFEIEEPEEREVPRVQF